MGIDITNLPDGGNYGPYMDRQPTGVQIGDDSQFVNPYSVPNTTSPTATTTTPKSTSASAAVSPSYTPPSNIDPYWNSMPTGASYAQLTPNGNAAQVPIKTGSNVGDVWIQTFIKSVNWQSKYQGFWIDGITGYAEFANVWVTGRVTASSGAIGGFIIDGVSVHDVADTFGLSSSASTVLGDPIPITTSSPLVIGQNYTISTYVAGDDFTNVGALSNALGVNFIATGTTPTVWTNGSILSSPYVRFYAGSTWATRYSAPFMVYSNGTARIGGFDIGLTSFINTSKNIEFDNNLDQISVGSLPTGTRIVLDGPSASLIVYNSLNNPTALLDGTSLNFNDPNGIASASLMGFGPNEMMMVIAGSGVTFHFNTSYLSADGGVLTSGLLIPGQSYTITFYVAGDDFTNVGGVNITGNTFIATGTTPAVWTNLSLLSSTAVIDLGTPYNPFGDLYLSGTVHTSSVVSDLGTNLLPFRDLYLSGTIHDTGLQAFADDASTVGLSTGDFYQTDGAGAAPLNVAGIVMIKQ